MIGGVERILVALIKFLVVLLYGVIESDITRRAGLAKSKLRRNLRVQM